MVRFWQPFILRCGACGHRNRPHNVPEIGVRMVLTGKFKACRKCGNARIRVSDKRPLVRKIRAELIAEGITPVC